MKGTIMQGNLQENAVYKVGIISQARMNSTRLPGKILLQARDKTLLDYHCKRLQDSGLPVFIATTTGVSDDLIAGYCIRENIPYYRGDEEHVLSRYYRCASHHSLDIIVRVTSDCPLIDGGLIRQAVLDFIERGNPWLYVSNVLQRTYPRGFDFEVFSFQALEDAFLHAQLPGDLEHVTPYIHQNRSGKMEFLHVLYTDNKSAYRITLDTAADFSLLKTLIETHEADKLGHTALINLLDAHPELVAINAHVEQKPY